MKFLALFWTLVYAYTAYKLKTDGWQFIPIVTGSFGVASIATFYIGIPIYIVAMIAKFWRRK